MHGTCNAIDTSEIKVGPQGVPSVMALPSTTVHFYSPPRFLAGIRCYRPPILPLFGSCPPFLALGKNLSKKLRFSAYYYVLLRSYFIHRVWMTPAAKQV